MPVSSTVWCPSTWRSPCASTVRSSSACRASASSMWSKNPMPVCTAASPRPSRSTRTWSSVSLVVRADLARPGLDASLALPPPQDRARSASSTASMSSGVPTEIRRHSRQLGARPRRRAPGCRAPPAAAGTPPAPAAPGSGSARSWPRSGYTVSPGMRRSRGRKPVARSRRWPGCAPRAAAAWSSATAAAARVTRFTLYGSLPLAISRATPGCASASPNRSPAMPIALEKVRSTTSRERLRAAAAAPSGRRTPGRPRRTRPARRSPPATRSTAPSGSAEPVGLFGELSTTTRARSRTAASISASDVVREIGPERHRQVAAAEHAGQQPVERERRRRRHHRVARREQRPRAWPGSARWTRCPRAPRPAASRSARPGARAAGRGRTPDTAATAPRSAASSTSRLSSGGRSYGALVLVELPSARRARSERVRRLRPHAGLDQREALGGVRQRARRTGSAQWAGGRAGGRWREVGGRLKRGGGRGPPRAGRRGRVARNGLVMKSSAPSSKTRTSLSSSPLAVSTTTGMARVAGRERSCCSTL